MSHLASSSCVNCIPESMVDEGKFLYTNAEISACSESLRGPLYADNWLLLTKFLGQDPRICIFNKYSGDTDSAEAHVFENHC